MFAYVDKIPKRVTRQILDIKIVVELRDIHLEAEIAELASIICVLASSNASYGLTFFIAV